MVLAIDDASFRFAYRRSPNQEAGACARHPVIVVGAGPAGLATAIDLAQHGRPVLLLDDDPAPYQGPRAIRFARRTPEVFGRLGCGDPMVAKGVTWSRGRVFHRDEAGCLDHPRIWTAERDVEMWRALKHGTAMKPAELDR